MAALFNTTARADVYKLEIKEEANNVLRFCAENLDKKQKNTFVVQRNVYGNYVLVPENNAIDNFVTDLVFGEKVNFKIGSISVSCCSEAGDSKIVLNGGCVGDSLVIESIAYQVVIKKNTSLKLNTLAIQNGRFKSEGTLEAFITCLRNCEAENSGKFSSRNLFLIRADIVNFGTITLCDAYRNIECSIKNFDRAGKKGTVEIGKATGNTRVMKEIDSKVKMHNLGGKKCVDLDGAFVPLEDISRYPEYRNWIKRNEINMYPVKTGRYTVVVTADFWCHEKKKPIEVSSSNVYQTDPKGLFVGQTLASAELTENPACFEKHILMTSGQGVSIWTPKIASQNSFTQCFISVDDDPRMYFIYDNPNDHKTE